jgi:hypothetical protein
LRRILSNILDIMGKRLIGLYDETIWGFTRFVDHDYLGKFPQYWEVGKSEYYRLCSIVVPLYLVILSVFAQ